MLTTTHPERSQAPTVVPLGDQPTDDIHARPGPAVGRVEREEERVALAGVVDALQLAQEGVAELVELEVRVAAVEAADAAIEAHFVFFFSSLLFSCSCWVGGRVGR